MAPPLHRFTKPSPFAICSSILAFVLQNSLSVPRLEIDWYPSPFLLSFTCSTFTFVFSRSFPFLFWPALFLDFPSVVVGTVSTHRLSHLGCSLSFSALCLVDVPPFLPPQLFFRGLTSILTTDIASPVRLTFPPVEAVLFSLYAIGKRSFSLPA